MKKAHTKHPQACAGSSSCCGAWRGYFIAKKSRTNKQCWEGSKIGEVVPLDRSKRNLLVKKVYRPIVCALVNLSLFDDLFG